MTRRFALADLPEVIPVFPLPGALLLPRARLPLNIFEPRYLAMLDDALRSDHRLIGMVQPFENSGQPPKLHSIGCAGRVTSLSETEDGRYLIALSGVCRFRLRGELDGFTPYRRVRADWTDFAADLGRVETDAAFDRDAFLALLRQYFESAHLSSDWDAMREAEPEMLINSLSMMCPFSVEERQALLEAPRLSDRCDTLVALMRFAIASGGSDGNKVQ
ncbi:LON peptidase substrate-binding domain-containing protein [Limibaculum sp. M0105]|uniref:LON peptidase substrate-binding domain-containing protein n=1 Tax=Thermohalobaculum xanthum TaxID=2753746 RepID=A0A8J7MAP9_9RHOB|nr:LON peptidase substrate-binding domain-containing protein [Thermohalobaculum xanthum]MBK0400732.1 LON peptidase substrate-binding domain-containing protein [Thermohalobaculum xanthum]